MTDAKEHLDLLSQYLESYVYNVYNGFDRLVAETFEGRSFTMQLLTTAHRFWRQTKSSQILQALKIIVLFRFKSLAPLVYRPPVFAGEPDDTKSELHKQTIAPNLVHYSVENLLRRECRRLQQELLKTLSDLYAKVSAGDKLEHFPWIFLLSAINLIIWEEMVYESYYDKDKDDGPLKEIEVELISSKDPTAVESLRGYMQITAVPTIIGRFHATSQRIPKFSDWDTSQHGHLFNSDKATCEMMTEMRVNVRAHRMYFQYQARKVQHLNLN